MVTGIMSQEELTIIIVKVDLLPCDLLLFVISCQCKSGFDFTISLTYLSFSVSKEETYYSNMKMSIST